jgi:cryptochrome
MYKHDIYVAHPFSFPHSTPNFDKMIDNPIARQIPWDDDPDLLLAWKMSKTGYPYIDAIMTQLRETGWIHHLARHSVACFLTRGDLWQSWEDGATVFEEYLIDADWSINNFNWQWLSCTAHFYQYFRCYSPIAFGKKTDP